MVFATTGSGREFSVKTEIVGLVDSQGITSSNLAQISSVVERVDRQSDGCADMACSAYLSCTYAKKNIRT